MEWQEFHPNDIPKSTTGWHLIWLDEKIIAFEIVSTGGKYTLVKLNNGGRMELDNHNFYDIALNAAPPEPVKLPVSERDTSSRPLSQAEIISAKLEATAPSNALKRDLSGNLAQDIETHAFAPDAPDAPTQTALLDLGSVPTKTDHTKHMS